MLDGGTMPLLSALMLLPKAYSQKLPKKLPVYATPDEKCSEYLAKPILINRLCASGLKATSAEAQGRVTRMATT